MKRLLFILAFVFCAGQLVSAQSYYYKKAQEEFRQKDPEWAVNYLEDGVEAGEYVCYPDLIRCYLNEIGTPLKVSRAVELLKAYSEKDKNAYLFLSYLYDQSNYSFPNKKPYLGEYSFASLSRERQIWPTDMTLALKYARLYDEQVSTDDSQEWLDYVEFECYTEGLGGLPINYEKALEIALKYECKNDFSTEELFKLSFENAKSLKDLAQYVSLREKIGDKMFEFFLDEDVLYDSSMPSDFLEKFDKFYNPWVKSIGGVTKLCAKFYTTLSEQETFMIERVFNYKMCSAYINHDKEELLRLYEERPPIDETYVSKLLTRYEVRELLSKPGFIKWESFKEILDDPNYSGSTSEKYINTTRDDLIKFYEERVVNFWDGLHHYWRSIDINRYEAALNDFLLLCSDMENRQFYDSLNKRVSAILADIQDYRKLLEDEKNSSVSIDVYQRYLKEGGYYCKKHADLRLREFMKHREKVESSILKMVYLSGESRVIYTEFRQLLLDGDIKALKPEKYYHVFNTIVKKNIAQSYEAIDIYPYIKSTEILDVFLQEADVCVLLDMFHSKTLKKGDCDAFLRHYKSSKYKTLISSLKESKKTKEGDSHLAFGQVKGAELEVSLPKIKHKPITLADGTSNTFSMDDYFNSRVLFLGKPANCYVVSASGGYIFRTVKGNSSESVGSVASAAVLWESFGTSTTPRVGDLIKKVAYNNGYLYFQTADTFREGNAVIAVKDANGRILWSWHIWLTDQPKGQTYYRNAGTMMDRNLGATSATPGDVGALGLLYQWGRKDPFLGSSSISSRTLAESTITWPSSVYSYSSTGTIAYATAHPTTFITYNDRNYDWYYTGLKSTDNTRWTTSEGTKSIYDPCPAGWRVPDGGSNGVWSKALGSSKRMSCPYDDNIPGVNFSGRLGVASTIWYPASGYRYGYDGGLNYVGYGGGYWSASPYDGNAYYLYFYDNGSVNPSDSNSRANGQSVRCIQE